MTDLARRVLARDRAAVASALTLVEDRRARAEGPRRDLLRALAAAASAGALGASPVGLRVGLTGPAGAGKSTLLSAVSREIRRRGRTVGVLAVDPSSPRSGGAVLGDRIRIDPDPDDDGIFVRSMAAQGELGGLARAAAGAVDVLGAAFDVVLVETTGVGQSEVDVERVADVVVVVVQPGSGDTLQFFKAGVVEIADLFVVSKADIVELADQARRDLISALGQGRPILAASARTAAGIDALVDALEAAAVAARDTFRARRARGAAANAVADVARRWGEHGVERAGGEAELARRAEVLAAAGEPGGEIAARLGELVAAAMRG